MVWIIYVCANTIPIHFNGLDQGYILSAILAKHRRFLMQLRPDNNIISFNTLVICILLCLITKWSYTSYMYQVVIH